MSPNLIHTSSLNRIYLVPILLVYPLRAGPVCVCVFKAPRTRHPGVGDPARVHSVAAQVYHLPDYQSTTCARTSAYGTAPLPVPGTYLSSPCFG